ncbi:uncharacterized protein CCOS01_14462 [Colletotrichum costaricense]|uniref:Uncharacterized protein n=1 Tax=Colletotrichum costaricense TaxID=1209916 RepID=A0AAI9YJN8_9PEZI|nr:uncharacterized protein CCOS01_14462 [Colletotrichum costaricense]KAK1513520.1 hypothetical protein CCOS01_14462 [Colletotrichum costaricense]
MLLPYVAVYSACLSSLPRPFHLKVFLFLKGYHQRERVEDVLSSHHIPYLTDPNTDTEHDRERNDILPSPISNVANEPLAGT